jgi:DNA-directed RNA polymerase specialized sigma subunit
MEIMNTLTETEDERIERLYEKYKKLAQWIGDKKIKKHGFLTIYRDEVKDGATDGLLSAIRSDKFDENDAKATGYVSTCIIRSIFAAIKKIVNVFKTEADRKELIDDGILTQSIDVLGLTQYCRFKLIFTTEHVQKILEVTEHRDITSLSKKEQQTIFTENEAFVIDQIYYQDKTKADIERATDFTKQYIYQLELSALKKMKRVNYSI